MSAETLRRAAALMRERAEAATPGPWESFEDEGGRETGHGWGIGGDRRRPEGHKMDVLTHVGKTWGWGPSQENATHIASWHPAVALAVADWLEVVSDLYDDPEDRIVSEQEMWDRALAVAVAYLGESA